MPHGDFRVESPVDSEEDARKRGQTMASPERNLERGTRLRELALLFLRLGTTAFGGPAAHIAMMEEEVVRRRRWLSREEFLDMLGATNLVPGPNSTELAIHVGRARAGVPGLLVAGSCFILPATLMTLAIAWGYVRFGALPRVASFLYGAKPVITVVVLQALWRLGRTALKSAPLGFVAAAAVAASALGVHELAVLLGGGLLAIPARRWREAGGSLSAALPWKAGAPIVTAAIAGAAAPFSLTALFLFFLKVGSVLFGSGYVLLAFLRADLVERWHWLTNAQLLDAVGVGQFTPGPVFCTATFIGYLLGRTPGALLATLGIFLPAFVFVALSALVLPRLRRSRLAGAFLDGLNAASLALMVTVSWELGRTALVDWRTLLVAAAGALGLVLRINSAWLLLGGGAAGWLLSP
jgi:chromate transporter